MSKRVVTVEDTIQFLNELLDLDRDALSELFIKSKVLCSNDNLATHPTIQVGTKDSLYTLDPLGLLNGLFGTDDFGWGYICAHIETEGPKTGQIIKFTLTNYKPPTTPLEKI